jgi:iron complex transport system substrate-binding protein
MAYHPATTLIHAAAIRSLVALSLLVCGCGRGTSPAPVSSGKSPTVASLVPSATDLIIAMGAGDHLIAVSNYDRESKLPRVGDYIAIDWEKIAQLKPNVMVCFFGAGHAPAGLNERTHELGVQVINLKFDHVADIYTALEKLGDACSEQSKAADELARIQKGLAAVKKSVAGQPRVRALIVTEMSGLDFAGRSNYLDDLLNDAGGENAITTRGFVTLDREAIAALKPDVILQLLPAADADARARNKAFWDSFPDVPAVREHRVWQFTEGYMMTPGSHVAEVAAKFAAALHPPTASASSRSTANGGS